MSFLTPDFIQLYEKLIVRFLYSFTHTLRGQEEKGGQTCTTTYCVRTVMAFITFRQSKTKCCIWSEIREISSGICLAAQLCSAWGLSDLDWNVSVHILLSKLKKKWLETPSNTERLNPTEKKGYRFLFFFYSFFFYFGWPPRPESCLSLRVGNKTSCVCLDYHRLEPDIPNEMLEKCISFNVKYSNILDKATGFPLYLCDNIDVW